MVEVAEASADSNVGTVSNATSGQAGQVITQEPIHTLSATLASDNVITAPATVLPSHVYVLNNREIVTDKTSSQIDELLGTTEEPSSHREATSHCGTIKASVTGASSRLIVVDEDDRIVEIWSNTTGMKRGFYSLRVKEHSWLGLGHPLTPGILAQYNDLLGKLDWTNEGRVY